jgi:rubrerythrin
MPDISAIASFLSSLNAAKDIAQTMVSLHDTAAFQAKLIEFQSKLIDANNAAFAAQDERSALLEQVRELKKQVADLKAWETEKKRYELKEVFGGAFAYVLKQEARGTEPIHWLCAKCYQEGKPSILQRTGRLEGREYQWACPTCKATIRVRFDISPGKPAQFPVG